VFSSEKHCGNNNDSRHARLRRGLLEYVSVQVYVYVFYEASSRYSNPPTERALKEHVYASVSCDVVVVC
jgi:hypothetical protein